MQPDTPQQVNQPTPAQQAFSSFQTNQQPTDPGQTQSAIDSLQQKSKQIASIEDAIKKKNEQAWLSMPNQQGPISQALAQLNPTGSDTQTNIGKAIKTPAYAGYCLKYVDDKTGNTNRQPTAFADYEVNAKSGNIQTSDKNIPSGARVYFAPDATNGKMGHVGLMNSDGSFTAATDNGIQSFTIPDWEKYSGQKYIGATKK